MPRGGKRPGAGAPRGNMNGLKHGRSVRYNRAQLVLDVLALFPPRAYRALCRELYAAGLVPLGRRANRRDIRRFFAYLAQAWFDWAPGSQSNPIKRNQLEAITAVLRDAYVYEQEQIHAEAASAPPATRPLAAPTQPAGNFFFTQRQSKAENR